MKDEAAQDEPRRATGENGDVPDVGTPPDGAHRLLESWAQSHASLMNGAFGLGQEMLTFSQERFQADVEAWQALLACRNAGDWVERQKEITEKARAHYADHANRLARRLIDILHDATAPFRKRGTKS